MEPGQLWKFRLWALGRSVFRGKFSGMTILWKSVDILGTIMSVVGLIIFLTAPQWGESNYDYTVKLDTPQPITSGSTLIAANDRVYVFSEKLCAVNVYRESGEFLFCVRGVRNQNGKAHLFLSGTDINIISRRHVLFRFDENGNYRGKRDNVHPDAQRMTFLVGQDKDGDTLPAAEIKGYTFAADKSTMAAEDAVYSVRLNRVYRTTSSGSAVFASTPLYLYYIKSPLLGWLTLVLGMLFRKLAEKFAKTQGSKQQFGTY